MKNYPMQYSLVYFAPLKEWGELTGNQGVMENRRIFEVRLRNGSLIYPTLEDMTPIKDYYVVNGWCE